MQILAITLVSVVLAAMTATVFFSDEINDEVTSL